MEPFNVEQKLTNINVFKSQDQVYTYPLNFIWMCSLSRLPVAKNHNFGQFLTFFGVSCTDAFYWWGPNLVCYSRPTIYAYVPNFVSIGIFCRPLAAKTSILPYFWLRHSVGSPVGSNLRKLSTEPHQTCHGNRGRRARSCTPKTFGDLMHSFAARGAEYLGTIAQDCRVISSQRRHVLTIGKKLVKQ